MVLFTIQRLAFREPGTDFGRGKGGLVQLSTKEIRVSKQKIPCSSPRIQAQILSFSTIKILWINTYMPCDSQQGNQDNSELINTLSQVENIINENQNCYILWSGDMNWDSSRKTNFSNIFHCFVKKFKLKSAWEKYPTEFSHIHTDGVSTSLIDHFLISFELEHVMDSCEAVHVGDNLSRHSPIIL